MTFYQIDTLLLITNVGIFTGYGCPINFYSYSYVDLKYVYRKSIQFLVTLFSTFCKKCKVRFKSRGFVFFPCDTQWSYDLKGTSKRGNGRCPSLQ
jgi:hypothetical protein